MAERIRNMTETIATCVNRITGLDALPAGTKIVVRGVEVDVKAVMQACIDAAQQLEHQRGVVHAALVASRKANDARLKLDEGLKAWLTTNYGLESTIAAAFGFAPRKKTVKSPATKKAAAEKNRATRKARNTMGKRQRLKIKGVLPPEGEGEGGGG